MRALPRATSTSPTPALLRAQRRHDLETTQGPLHEPGTNQTNRPRKQQKRPLLDFGGCKPAEGKRVGLPGSGGGLTPAPPVCFYSHLHCTSPPPPSLVCNCAGYFFWTQDVVKVKTFISIVVSPAFSVCLFNSFLELSLHEPAAMIIILRILFQRGQVYPQPLNYPKWALSGMLCLSP